MSVVSVAITMRGINIMWGKEYNLEEIVWIIYSEDVKEKCNFCGKITTVKYTPVEMQIIGKKVYTYVVMGQPNPGAIKTEIRYELIPIQGQSIPLGLAAKNTYGEPKQYYGGDFYSNKEGAEAVIKTWIDSDNKLKEDD